MSGLFRLHPTTHSFLSQKAPPLRSCTNKLHHRTRPALKGSVWTKHGSCHRCQFPNPPPVNPPGASQFCTYPCASVPPFPRKSPPPPPPPCAWGARLVSLRAVSPPALVPMPVPLPVPMSVLVGCSTPFLFGGTLFGEDGFLQLLAERNRQEVQQCRSDGTNSSHRRNGSSCGSVVYMAINHTIERQCVAGIHNIDGGLKVQDESLKGTNACGKEAQAELSAQFRPRPHVPPHLKSTPAAHTRSQPPTPLTHPHPPTSAHMRPHLSTSTLISPHLPIHPTPTNTHHPHPPPYANGFCVTFLLPDPSFTLGTCRRWGSGALNQTRHQLSAGFTKPTNMHMTLHHTHLSHGDCYFPAPWSEETEGVYPASATKHLQHEKVHTRGAQPQSPTLTSLPPSGRPNVEVRALPSRHNEPLSPGKTFFFLTKTVFQCTQHVPTFIEIPNTALKL